MKYPAYPEYKESGVEWLDRLPVHWGIGKFSREVQIAEGQVDPEVEPYLSMPLIAPNHIESGTGRLISIETAADQFAESGKYLCKAGNVIYSKIRPALQKAVIAPSDCLCSADMYPMNCRQELSNQYLFWLLLSKSFTGWSVLEADRVAMPKINRETLNLLRLPVPALEEQQAIARFLDAKTAKIDELIAKKRELIETLKEKRSALIARTVTQGLPPEAALAAGLDPYPKMKDSGVEWLGKIPEHWDTKKLGHIALLKSGENIVSEEMQDDGLYPVYGGNGRRGFYDQYTHDGSYVLIGRQGALCGNVNYAEGKFWASEHALVVNPLKHFNTIWFGTVLQVMNLNQYSVSAAQPGLAASMLSALKIPFPPLVEQSLLADYLKRQTLAINQLEQIADSAICRLTEYRQALITAAVTGKIDVREVA